MSFALSHDRGADAAEHQVSNNSFRSRLSRGGSAVGSGVQADRNRAGDISHNDVIKKNIFNSRSSSDPDFNGTSIRFINNAIGNHNVFGFTAPKPKDRPTRAESAVRHGDELVAAEESASVVLTGNVAIRDVDKLAADDVETVIVLVDPIVNAHGLELHVPAFKDPHAMISAGGEERVANAQIFAAIEDNQMWAVDVSFFAFLARTGVVAAPGIELCALAIDSPGPLDSDVLGTRGVEQDNIAVAGGNAFARGIMFDISGAQKPALGGKIETDIALQLDCPDDEISRGDKNGPAALPGAGIDGVLHGRGIDSLAVPFRPIIANVVNASAGREFQRERGLFVAVSGLRLACDACACGSSEDEPIAARDQGFVR